MNIATATKQKITKLAAPEIIAALVAENILGTEDAKKLILKTRVGDHSKTNPLILIAGQNYANHQQGGSLLTVEFLSSWLADHVGLPYERIDPLDIDVPGTTAVVSHAYASRLGILPIRVSENSVVFATADPFRQDWVDELNQLLRKNIERVVCNPADIERYLNEFYNLARSVKNATLDNTDSAYSIVTNLEQLVELGQAGKLDAEDHHIVHIVDWLLQYAFEQRASDIHIEPRRDQADIRFRIDGVLHRVYQVPPNVMNAIVNRVKTLGRMDVAEKRRPQDGRLKTKTPEGIEIELRLSTISTAMGEKLVMRIFDPAVLKRNFKELGLTPKEYETWEAMVQQPHGIVLVTGPTGSGKTTTLYSTLRQLATSKVNVCTIEDPIEMIEPTFNQMQVQQTIDLDFAAGVRSLLRQDPDIIMIGEIRDMETAEMAVQSALTGHLVFSTLHTNDAPSAITRLMEIGVPSYLINATLIGVVAQRLVRTICPSCKTSEKTDLEKWKALTEPWKVEAPKNTWVGKGCLECRNTGYKGRIGLYEMLTLSENVQKTVMQDPSLSGIRSQAVKIGMQPLRISGARKITAGLTTFKEVIRVIPKEFRFDD